MSGILMVLAGAMVGGGLFVAIAGATGHLELDTKEQARHLTGRPDLLRRGFLAALGFGLAWAMTSWPVVAVATGLLGWWSPELLTDRRARRQVELTEAIAAWAAMLADTITASAGIERAVLASVDHGPVVLRPELRRIEQALRVGHVGVTDALAEFASRLGNPTADLVAVTVKVATQQGSPGVAQQLRALAESAAAESKMLNRVAAARRGMLVFKRVVLAIMLGVGVVLPLGAPALGKAYQTLTGQVFLALVCMLFASALWWMERLSSYHQPRHFGTETSR